MGCILQNGNQDDGEKGVGGRGSVGCVSRQVAEDILLHGCHHDVKAVVAHDLRGMHAPVSQP